MTRSRMRLACLWIAVSSGMTAGATYAGDWVGEAKSFVKPQVNSANNGYSVQDVNSLQALYAMAAGYPRQPIPPAVRAQLSNIFPADFLDKTFAVSDVNGLLYSEAQRLGLYEPGGFIVGNFLVLEPPTGATDIAVWRHLLTHNYQVARWGMPLYATRWYGDRDFVESDAQAIATSAYGRSEISVTPNADSNRLACYTAVGQCQLPADGIQGRACYCRGENGAVYGVAR